MFQIKVLNILHILTVSNGTISHFFLDKTDIKTVNVIFLEATQVLRCFTSYIKLYYCLILFFYIWKYYPNQTYKMNMGIFTGKINKNRERLLFEIIKNSPLLVLKVFD